jgi:hypothetical protein
LYLSALLLQGFYNLKIIPANNFNATILFLVGGLAQFVQAIPTIRNWAEYGIVQELLKLLLL